MKANNTLPLQVGQSPVGAFVNPVAADTRVYGGALVALDAAGNAVPAAPASSVMRGVAMAEADNTAGAAGDLAVETLRGCWLIKNDGSLDRTHIGQSAYVVDDETVGAAGTLVAGKCLDITDGGVVVEIL